MTEPDNKEILISLGQELSKVFTDDLIRKSFVKYFFDNQDMCEFEVDGIIVAVSPEVELEVITKSFAFEDFFDFAPVRVRVAVGGVESNNSGILRAKHLFLAMLYNINLELITVDVLNKVLL